MAAYRLTNKAEHDLLAIGRFTSKRWGVSQRNFYLKQFDSCFAHIAENPLIGTACDFIMTDYRKFPHGSHMIFYKQTKSGAVEIIRILHKSMDVESKL